MPRFLAALLAATAVFGVTAVPAAAQSLDIPFRTAITNPHGTCDAIYCAPVTVPGYGEGTLTFNVTNFEPISRSCFEDIGITQIEFLDPAIETIVMSETGMACFPGNSFNAPGGEHSYGNPFHQTGTFVIESGTLDVRFAGAALRGVYSIELG
jgi:hypothetical protein